MAIVYVRENAANFTTTVGTTIAIPVTVGATAGNTVILVFAARDTVADVTSVTDTQLNAWTVDAQFTDPTGKALVVVASTRQNVGTLTVTDTITTHHTTAVSQDAAWLVEEFSGLAAAPVVDATSVNGSNGAAPAGGQSGAIQAAYSSELIVVGYSISDGANAATKDAAYSAFTTTFKGDGNISGLSKIVAGGYLIGAAALQQATFTWSVANAFNAVIVGYPASGATVVYGPPPAPRGVPFMSNGRI